MYPSLMKGHDKRALIYVKYLCNSVETTCKRALITDDNPIKTTCKRVFIAEENGGTILNNIFFHVRNSSSKGGGGDFLNIIHN